MTAFITARVKAVAAFVAAAVVSYVATAIVTGTAYTLHGVEVAAATAVLTALGVHQAPANAKKKAAPRKRAARSAGHLDVGYLLAIVVAVILLVVLIRVLFGTSGR